MRTETSPLDLKPRMSWVANGGERAGGRGAAWSPAWVTGWMVAPFPQLERGQGKGEVLLRAPVGQGRTSEHHC